MDVIGLSWLLPLSVDHGVCENLKALHVKVALVAEHNGELLEEELE